ncbi:MAG TPA: response regulator transcription factor [Ktedonobacteraceae bacterium]|jgi:DNA-binding response OmpR family regulator|nr:response regulator transcription factor [Ktedonobacteraceae bacterium]
MLVTDKEIAPQKNKHPRVLIVDDEPQIIDFLQMGFAYEGFEVCIATNGPDAIHMVAERQPDIIILDIMLPGYDGWEVTRQVRRGQDVPIIMLTAKDEVDDRVNGLDLGADDYLTKPFAFRELIARTRAVLRRHGNNLADILTFQDIILDRDTHQVTLQDKPVDLTPREFNLLELFLMHPKQVLSRDVILSRIWGYDYMGDDNIVEVYIRHLREKLGDNPPRLLQTIRGVGYTLRG